MRDNSIGAIRPFHPHLCNETLLHYPTAPFAVYVPMCLQFPGLPLHGKCGENSVLDCKKSKENQFHIWVAR